MVEEPDFIVVPKQKYKILMLSDMQLSFSGVGVQSRFLIEGLLATGKYSFKCLGGAIKHENYETITVNPDFIVKPIDGFGTPELLRQLLITERPDALLIFTDPRQFIWLWQMEDEIHQLCPIAYWHVWDNDPYPDFNNVWYESTDVLNCLSYKTYEMVKTRFPTKTNYIPHAYPADLYKPLPSELVKEVKAKHFPGYEDWFIALWVNRNAHRKMPNDVLQAWKLFLDNLQKTHGHKKALLFMHTDPYDIEGPNLIATCDMLGLQGNVVFSTGKIGFQDMVMLHNIADCTINISRAEGFGLCLDGNTLTQTTDGYRKLKYIKEGDEVLSQDGRYHKVLATANRKENVMCSIHAYKQPKIKSSKEHPFLVANPNDLSEKYWVEASNLKPGNLLCVRRSIKQEQTLLDSNLDLVQYLGLLERKNLEITNNDITMKMGYSSKKNGVSISELQTQFGISKWHAEAARRKIMGRPWQKNRKNIPGISGMDFSSVIVNNEKTTVKRCIELNEDFFKFVGWYLAEGSSSGGRGIEIDLHEDEYDIAVWIQEYILKTFGILGTVEKFKKHSARFFCSSSVLAEFMEKLCGKHAYNKALDKMFHPYLHKYGSVFFASLFLGDGSHNKNNKNWTYATVSPKLAQFIDETLMLNNINCVTSVNATKHQDCFTTRITGNDYNRFCEFIKCDFEPALKNNITTIWDEEFVYTPVVSVRQTIEENTLYDIQVEDTENFIANGIVAHNSPLQSLMAAKPIVASYTGGHIRQLIDHRNGNKNGIPVYPAARTLIGSQAVPYIYDDNVSYKDVADAIMKLYGMGPERRAAMGRRAREYAMYEFNYEKVIKDWDKTLEEVILKWRENKPKQWSIVPLNTPEPIKQLPEKKLALNALMNLQPKANIRRRG